MIKNPKSKGVLSKGAESDSYGDEEIARRRDDVIRRMANTPPKQHKDMKLGQRKAKAGAKERPVSKGRVRKGKSRT